ncbi:MEDS domain-containing protein [Pseudonocardia spinosispora]|uniref:MEDS domain-containing protein n=1 Tax=Pseudonocardia spinosispora TaxID=103441 RepID=UPI000417E49E|nr:MEDS domain-containing protein [Pseudonocardia spinosispora]
MPQTLDALDLVGHTCMIPDSPEHVWETSAAWIAGGLRAGEKVMYFEDGSIDRLMDRLEDDRIPVARAMADGQFTVVPSEASRAGWAVPVEEVGPAFTQAIRETAEQGWPGVRFIAEPSRARLGYGLDLMASHEALIDGILLRNPQARLLCIYDRETFDDEAIAEMRRVHRTELVVSPMFDDGLLRITRPEPGTYRLAGEIDHSNSGVLRQLLDRCLEDMLRAATAPDDVTLDLSSIRFIDVHASTELLRSSNEFPPGHNLVLLGTRPHVRSLIERRMHPSHGRLVLPPRWDQRLEAPA